MNTAESILEFITGALKVASGFGNVVPGAAAPLKVAEVLVEASDGAFHKVTASGVEVVAAREAAAGASANKASHMAGLREAIEQKVARAVFHFDVPDIAVQEAVNAIMAEVARRMP